MTVRGIDDYLVDSNLPVADALRVINDRATQILLVVDADRRLLGTVTDGDIRRGILRKDPANMVISQVMNRSPMKGTEDWSPQQAESLMRVNGIHHIPVVDEAGVVVGIFTSNSLINETRLQNPVLLMVGGMGKRLGNMTANCPKPMLRIAGKPILQTIIESIRDAGMHRFTLALNYLGDQIVEYFKDGEWLGVEIAYCRETEPLGTAGALRLIDKPDRPLLVMNGDILTRLNFAHVIRYHDLNQACATMCVREFNQQVPFGVVDVSGNEIDSITEKPQTSFFVNSGIYVLNPETFDFLPESGPFDMPSLFNVLREDRQKTVAYPIQEYWTDIGQPGDFSEAEAVYEDHFN